MLWLGDVLGVRLRLAVTEALRELEGEEESLL
jgi:hypothetical protein